MWNLLKAMAKKHSEIFTFQILALDFFFIYGKIKSIESVICFRYIKEEEKNGLQD